VHAPGACNAAAGARLAAGGAAAAVTAVDGNACWPRAGGDENGVAQFERHNELRVGCPNAGNPLGVYKGCVVQRGGNETFRSLKRFDVQVGQHETKTEGGARLCSLKSTNSTDLAVRMP